MDRKEFLKNCGFTCMSGFGIAALVQSCSVTKQLNGSIAGDDLVIAVSDFVVKKGRETHFRKYVIVQNDLLQFPVCVYRLNENDYNALWMRCTHQGTELQVFGDKLQCPSHGSGFNNYGDVENGPASEQLRSFPVSVDNNQIKISLKAV